MTKKKKKKKIKNRNVYALLAWNKTCAGSHKDKKKEESKLKCRGKTSEE